MATRLDARIDLDGVEAGRDRHEVRPKTLLQYVSQAMGCIGRRDEDASAPLRGVDGGGGRRGGLPDAALARVEKEPQAPTIPPRIDRQDARPQACGGGPESPFSPPIESSRAHPRRAPGSGR